MKTFRRFLLLLVATVLTTTVRAQVINGDLNHNDGLDVEDVTLLIDGYLTGDAEYISPKINFYQEDNSLIQGKWYKSKTETVVFQENGLVEGFGQGNVYEYKFLPSQGRILLFAGGAIYNSFDVVYLTDEQMIIRYIDGSFEAYTRSYPVTKVNRIEICYSSNWDPVSQLKLTILANGVKGTAYLRALVFPEDADNQEVIWSSSDESVVTVDKGSVVAVGEGTAVIICEATDGSGVKDSCPVTVVDKGYNNGYKCVDLGLSVNWATMNVGANAPEEYGDYFAWGETTAKSTYTWENYKWCKGSEYTMTKYCTDSRYGTVDDKSVLDPEDDAAHVNWGGTWRMPTYDELNELMTKCTWTWTTQNSVDGYKVVGSNGNSIFLPAAGYRYKSSLYLVGYDGGYWSSSLYLTTSRSWYVFFDDSGEVDWTGYDRFFGRSVRAVCP